MTKQRSCCHSSGTPAGGVLTARQRPLGRLALGGILLLLAGVTASGAGLDWSVRAVELKADPALKNAVAVFPFKNTGDKPVVITSVIPSCDCLTPKLAKEFFAAGEAGELRVDFALGGRAGRQEKTITITTDDAPNSPIVLKLVVDIPEPVAISPKFVFWRVGEPAVEKSVEVTLADPEKVSLDGVQCAEPTFAVRLEPGKEPGRHRVVVRPADTAKPGQATIRLTATVSGNPKVHVIFAAVK